MLFDENNNIVGEYANIMHDAFDIDFDERKIQVYKTGTKVDILPIPKRCDKKNNYCKDLKGWHITGRRTH